MIDRHILPTFGDRPIDSIRKMDIESWVGGLRLARGSVRLLMHQASSIFEEAVNNELITRNPCRGVVLPPTLRAPEQTVPYSPAEVRLMLASVRGAEGIMLRLLLFCGLRPGEMLALRVGSLQERFLTVAESTDGGGRFKDTKTHKTRVVPVPPGLLSDLRAFLVLRGSDPTTPMFVTERHGRVWTVAGFRGRVGRMLAGVVEGFDLRRCRATCATYLRAEVADVRDILGHADQEMTLGHYRRGLPERQCEAVASLEKEMVQ